MKKCIPLAAVQLAVVLLATFVAGACAARGGAPVEQVTEPGLRHALLLSSAPGPPDRTCHVVREALPPADQLIDSVAVTDTIRRLDPSSVLLSIKFDTLGVTEFVRILESEGAAAERVAEVVEGSLRQQAESDAWRLKVVSGPDPVIRVGHSEFCRPMLLTGDVVDRVLSEAGVRGPARTVVMFRVGPEGRALETRVSHHTGPPGTARAFHSLGPYMLFEPALIDGFPTPVWVSISIDTTTPTGPAWSHGNQ